MKTKKKRNHVRPGTSIVEMAIILPLLFVMTFGAIKYSWLFFKSQQVMNATRQAARFAIRPDVSVAAVNAKIAALMSDVNMGGSNYNALISIGPSVGSNVTVTITVPVADVDIFKAPLLPSPVQNISASVTMSKEGP